MFSTEVLKQAFDFNDNGSQGGGAKVELTLNPASAVEVTDCNRMNSSRLTSPFPRVLENYGGLQGM